MVTTLLVAISAIRPQPRVLPNPELFRYYAEHGSGDAEVRSDLYEAEVSALEGLNEGNEFRARRLRIALWTLVMPLIFAAVGAVTLFFAS